MADRSGDEQLRTQLQAMWNSVATGWAENIDHIEHRGVGVATAMIDGVSPQAGERILEVACGTGATGLMAARRVGPTGMVTLSDAAPDMAAIAAGRATELGIANVSTAVLDIEQIEMPDATYDGLLCREGLMFAVDPARALGEFRRVLKPGGRVAVGVWADRERNPWLGLLLDAVTAEVGFPVPPPGLPGPFSLAEPGYLRELFVSAGFLDVTDADVDNSFRAPGFDGWWQRMSAMTGPVATIIGGLSPSAKTSLIARLEELVDPYLGDEGLELPGVETVVTATRD